MKKHALIVDDDPIIRNLMAALLRRRQFVSAQAVNGEEAIALIGDEVAKGHARPYDAILLDLMMPKKSGWDVIDFVEQTLPSLMRRIIVVTAAGENATSSLMTRGCCRVIEKPFDPEQLYAALDACTDERDGSGQATVTLGSFFF